MGKISDYLIKQNLLPKISNTEQVALQAGTNWIESDIFNGCLKWNDIIALPCASLTEEEQAFLDNEVELLCHMVNDWKVQQTRQISQEVIHFIHRNKFLGLMLPKKYGGLGFSNYAFSTILNKLASRNAYVCLYVLIPNSVGPGELIETYGTDNQKDDYLPQLASGEFVPCFALTEPTAGSDAVSITSKGTIVEKSGELFIRLNFNKRYISMAPVANLIGLAFNLHDPENYLKKGENVGITCALVHKTDNGVVMGNYHDPNGSVFPNGPVKGEDVYIPLSRIIGGPEKAGQGWKMLMEALSGGRGISLPAQATGIAKQMLQISAVYSTLRKQFNVPVAKFQGIEEVLFRMMSRAYSMEAVRAMISQAIDDGNKPAVASAIVKYSHTEMCRQNILDAMDILAGKAIMRGPKSIIGDNYRTAPIGVTVEGANILTRTLIQFGQGAIKCHPFIYKELNALIAHDDSTLLKLAGKHALHFAKNVTILLVNSVSRGRLNATCGKHCRREQQKISWATKRFAVIADLALLSNGPNLKKRGSLSGRLGDAMGSLLYAIATVKRVNTGHVTDAEICLAKWTVAKNLADFDKTLDAILLNFDVSPLSWLTRYLWRFTSKVNAISGGVSDKLAQKFGRAFLKGESASLSTITSYLYTPQKADNDALFALSNAYENYARVNQILTECKGEVSINLADTEATQDAISMLIDKKQLSPEEGHLLMDFVNNMDIVVGVDEFTQQQYFNYSTAFVNKNKESSETL